MHLAGSIILTVELLGKKYQQSLFLCGILVSLQQIPQNFCNNQLLLLLLNSYRSLQKDTLLGSLNTQKQK